MNAAALFDDSLVTLPSQTANLQKYIPPSQRLTKTEKIQVSSNVSDLNRKRREVLTPKVSLICPRPHSAVDKLQDLVASVGLGLQYDYEPYEYDCGSVGGVYVCLDDQDYKTAIFKPLDEEPYMPFNNKGKMSSGMLGLKTGIKPGEGAIREVVASYLHSEMPYFPAAGFVEIQYNMRSSTRGDDWEHSWNRKLGSLQKFMFSDGCSDDYDPSFYNVESVHAIAFADIRLLNLDRHGANVLVRRDPISNTSSFKDMDEIDDFPPFRQLDDIDESSSTKNMGRSRSMSAAGGSTTSHLLRDLPGGVTRSLSQEVPCGGLSTIWNSEVYYSSNDLPQPPQLLLDNPLRDLGVIYNRPSSMTEDYNLIPIDHTFILPNPVALEKPQLCWMEWPQSRKPFTETVIRAIQAINVEDDIHNIRQEFGSALPAYCYLTLRMGTSLLKAAAKYRLSPYEIGLVLDPDRHESPLQIQQIVLFLLTRMHENRIQYPPPRSVDTRIELTCLSTGGISDRTVTAEAFSLDSPRHEPDRCMMSPDIDQYDPSLLNSPGRSYDMMPSSWLSSSAMSSVIADASSFTANPLHDYGQYMPVSSDVVDFDALDDFHRQFMYYFDTILDGCFEMMSSKVKLSRSSSL